MHKIIIYGETYSRAVMQHRDGQGKSMCIIVLECNDGDDDALLNLMFEQLQIVDVMCMTIVRV
jgi:hypothetical protein